jgi:3-deoxy-D-manno-octulosonate 8-phosphate phosphatase (KDO 8-P phosphatase)
VDPQIEVADMKTPKVFVLDVDGVLTTGQFLYTEAGKAMKVFGPDDHDALAIITNYLDILFVTGDRKGFGITHKRVVEDMNFRLELVSTIKRVEWLKERFPLDQTIYMGDGIFDHYVFAKVGYSICPANGFHLARERANYVTRCSGGDRAVAEACLHIMETFFTPYNPNELPSSLGKLSGEWTI